MVETKRNNKLNKYCDLYEASQQKIEDEQLISESLLASIIKELKSSHIGFFADAVVNNFCCTSTRKQWKKVFFDKMNEIFFDDVKWEYVSISSMGHDTYGFSIYFKLNEIKYNLFVPHPKNITVNNILHAYLGRYHLSKEVRFSVYESIISSYDEDDIKAAIKKESEM